HKRRRAATRPMTSPISICLLKRNKPHSLRRTRPPKAEDRRTQRMKASEKQDLTKKLVSRLEKPYGRPPQAPDRSVLETLVYAVCLENDDYAAAEQSYKALHEHFHDLNEIRV